MALLTERTYVLLPPLVPLLNLLQFNGGALSYDWGHLQSNGNIKRIDAPKSLEY
jgi:hypothetical protein